MNKIVKYVVGIVAVAIIIAVLVLGYLTYQGQAPTAVAPKGAPVSTPVNPAALLRTPNASSTQQERGSYFDLVTKNAVETGSIDITSCSPNPVASSVKKGADLTFVNKDSMSHTVAFNPAQSFTVGTTSSKTVKADFGKFLGIYPFSCDGSRNPVGIVVLK
ncbi:MAG: hypothetical protein ABSF56_03200 [Minisyncoccia bacterium]|jgi:plastocyanin